jgi:hypothetical protein
MRLRSGHPGERHHRHTGNIADPLPAARVVASDHSAVHSVRHMPNRGPATVGQAGLEQFVTELMGGADLAEHPATMGVVEEAGEPE